MSPDPISAPSVQSPLGSRGSSAPTSTAALQLRDVRKVYGEGDTATTALERADLEVGSDEIVALIGPSGSGKSTLLSIAGAILTPTNGAVVVAGRDISNLAPKALTAFRRDTVGFVFQSVNLVPFLTARENLLVLDELGRRTGKAARDRADQLLDELGLTKRAGNLPRQLSGGERQRVAIGRALMNEPKLVLLDEPTSALDSKLGDQVMTLIRDEVKQRDTAAILVTHDERIVHYADRSVHIADGVLAG